DAFAVTATGIGFGIARSIPWIGNVAADLFFGGAFPTLGSLARLYTIHVFVVPALIALLVSVHLLIILKQKHTQPGYARPLAEPGKVLGVPAWPYQALLAGELLLVMFGALFLLSAFVPPHPLAAYGPPSPATPEVKPDWYLMWIYGFLKIVPSQASVSLFGATIGPTFLGGLLFPAVVFAVLTFTPWIDRANRLAVRRVEYLQPPRQSPVRFALGLAVLAFLGTLFIAAYYDTLGLTLGQIWGIVIATPIVVGVVSYAVARQTEPAVRFDPSGVTEPVVAAPAPPTAPPVAALSAASAPQPAAALPPNAPPARTDVVTPGPAGEIWAYPTPAARADQARDNLVAALHEAAELAPLVRQLESDPALLEVLDYIDSLRLSLAESNQILQGVLRAAAAERAADGGTADGAPAE
ncbi:MAG TPA: cytochrome b N-terminal domain-containing protein, partial [Thermomicrobiales bacterium]|nr:cytochrome b N-terminal domain-containing protein [Thermomicrobiales bacterium]